MFKPTKEGVKQLKFLLFSHGQSELATLLGKHPTLRGISRKHLSKTLGFLKLGFAIHWRIDDYRKTHNMYSIYFTGIPDQFKEWFEDPS